jgi:uncharacterized membrane protein
MASPRPGWLVALCAAVLAVSVWLPWLSTSSDGGGRATAIGGTVGLLVAGAMAARGFSPRAAAGAALAISVLIAALTAAYYHNYVVGPVVAGYGLYLGAGAAVAAVGCSVWALIATLRTRAR